MGVKFHENKTVTYHQARYWFFDEKGTNGSYDDNVTTLNMVALVSNISVLKFEL